MKVAILIEALVNRGGMERVALTQALHFKADIYTGAYDPEKTFPEFKNMKVTVVAKGSIRGLGHLRARRAFSKLRIPGYDLYIYHNSVCLEAAPYNRPGIWYCHAPSRWLYDLYPDELAKRSFLGKIPFAIIRAILKRRDQRNVRALKLIATNSRNVQDRVKRFYGLDAIIINPPIDVTRYKWLGQKEYYLSTARLDPIKRVDLIVQAFHQLPEKKLVVSSTGPDKDRIAQLAAGKENITLLGPVSDEQLARLYGECIALICPSYKEDFGMIPAEAAAAGKPAIATNDGGYLETVIPGKTGILIDEPVTPDKIAAAVRELNPAKAKTMRKACEENAQRFSVERFNREMEDAARLALSS